MAERARGQDTVFTMISGGDIVADFLAQDVTVETVMSVDSQRYIGETANRYAESFEGYRLQVSGHAEGSSAIGGVLAVFDAVERRARGEKVGHTIHVSSTLFFPNGDLRSWTGKDVRFENPSYQVRGNEFITFSFSANCSAAKRS
ncbi:MAG: hypothetical protein Q8R92_21080 [Deltaproteobacteria bacterium]|nr:hypothetical protein [Deltaproteobacteria bacterium]